MEIPIINYLSTSVKLQSNVYSFNNSNGTTNLKVISEHNDSHVVKTDEFTLYHLKQSILKDLKNQYLPITHSFNYIVITSLKDHIKSLESEI